MIERGRVPLHLLPQAVFGLGFVSGARHVLFCDGASLLRGRVVVWIGLKVKREKDKGMKEVVQERSWSST